MPIRLFLYLSFLLFSIICNGQNSVKDSLVSALRISETPREQAKFNGDISVYFYNTQIYFDSAYYYNERAYEISKEHNIKGEEARALFNFGLIHSRLNDYDIALDYFERAYELFSSVGTTANLSVVNSSIAALYFEKEDYANAEIYFKKAIDLSKKQRDLLSLAIDNINLGQTEYRMGNYLQSKIHLEDGIQLLEELNYPISAARIYYGNTLLAMDRKREAKMQANIGYDLAIKEKNVEYIADACKLLHSLSVDDGDYKKALSYYEDYTLYKDSLNAAKEMNNIEKLRLNFNLSQKEKDLKQLSVRNKYLTTIYILLGIGVLLLVIFIINQRKISNMTASMHDIQTRLVGQELEKRTASSTEDDPEATLPN